VRTSSFRCIGKRDEEPTANKNESMHVWPNYLFDTSPATGFYYVSLFLSSYFMFANVN
jgi:hypothetical protein